MSQRRQRKDRGHNMAFRREGGSFPPWGFVHGAEGGGEGGEGFERSLEAERRTRFVGRDEELDRLTTLVETDGDTRLVFVHGPTGVGKSWFLRKTADVCRQQGHGVCWWSPDEVGAPEDMAHAFEEVLAEWEGKAARRLMILCDWDLAPARSESVVLGRLAPMVPDWATLVMAGRQGPPHGWKLHGAWGARMVEIGLSPLSKGESLELIERMGVAEPHREAVQAYGSGLPLLLTLAAQTVAGQPDAALRRHVAEDAIRKMLPSLGVATTSLGQRAALRVAAMARGVTPEMLRLAIDDPARAEASFRWLSRCTFIDDTAEGLRMHEVVRRGLLQEMRAHYPCAYRELHSALKGYCAAQVEGAIDAHRWIACMLYLDRQMPDVRPYLSWEGNGGEMVVEAARASDWELLHRSVLEHEGEASARILKHWVSALPDAMEVVRGQDRAAQGMIVSLPLDRSMIDEHSAVDPAFQVLGSYVSSKGLDEGAALGLVHRYWFDLETYQSPSRVTTELVVHMAARGMGLQDMPVTAAVVRDGAAWARFGTVIDVPVERAGEFELDGDTYVVLALCWEGRARSDWLREFSRRQLEATGGAWWRRVASQASSSGTEPPGLRDTLRPGPSRSSSKGGLQGSGGLGDLIMQRMRRLAEEAQLTNREIEVLDLLLLGRNTEEIAFVLDISPRTAKFHQGNVLRKLGADSRADLVRLLL